MALRVLIKHWNKLSFGNGWEQFMEYNMSGEECGEVLEQVSIFAGDNDSQAQIRAAVSAAIRALAVSKYGAVVETNQIIWPDGTRS